MQNKGFYQNVTSFVDVFKIVILVYFSSSREGGGGLKVNY